MAVRDMGQVHEGMQRMVLGAGDSANLEQGGNGNGAAGRGSVRGRRQLPGSETLLTRPQDLGSKKGTAGSPIRLLANYFQLLTHTDWSLYQYRVDFAPEEDRTRIKKQLFYMATKDVLAGYLFDGSMVFTSRRLAQSPAEFFVNPPEGGGDQPIRITMKLVGDVTLGDYHLIQFFNILMRKCLTNMNLQLVGRNFYDALAKIPVSKYDIELWPGYVTSIRQHENTILLCCEISHKFMRQQSVLNVLRELYNEGQRDIKERFVKRIIGSVVLTDYNNRTYRIDDVDWNVTPQSTFNRSDGRAISYVQYYKERYQLNIVDMNQPMLVSRAKPRELRAGMAEILYLVPELCRMTGLTDQERGNMLMMRELADHTRLTPVMRMERLNAFQNRMRSNPKIVEELKRWDMELAHKLIEFPGRVLPPEQIIQGRDGTKKYPSGEKTDWTQNLRSNQMLQLGEIKCWVVITPGNMKNDVFNFVQMLQRAASGMSLNLPQPRLEVVLEERPSGYLDAIERALKYDPQLLLICAPNNKVDRYSAIKKKTLVDKPVPTQVILKKNILSKGAMSIATKVAIQINCKLGGAPWTVEMPLSSLMVVGYDVCHDTMNKGRSFGAMVASLDKHSTHYFSSVSAHTNGEELSNDFSLNIIKAVKKWEERNNGNLPGWIMIYRDGVGDGQLPYVYDHEVKDIKNTLTAYYKDKPLKMAFIVVTKRINTRLFAGSQNPPPGTVVDDVITLPQRYDFYIVSQCVRQGTVSPTSYNVVYDTLGLNPDKIQRLTYKFTHMYYNWSGTVRVPAPCQYAHKLAFLISQAVHRNPSPALENRLYFL